MTNSPSPVYDTIGQDYLAHRRAEPRWEAVINEQLGDARVVVNVGAGTGSYEPRDRVVVAIDPSSVMVSQRAPGTAPAVRASGSALPLPSGSADVAMAILTMHHWDDWATGLAELCRVAPRRIVLTMDFEMHSRFWFLEDYVPEVGAFTRSQEPGYEAVAEVIGGGAGGAGGGAGGAGVRVVRAVELQSFHCSCRGTCRTACSAPTGAGPRPTWTRRCGPTAPGWRWRTQRWWLGVWLP